MKKVKKCQLQLFLVLFLFIGFFTPIVSTKAAYDLTPGYVLTRVDRSSSGGIIATTTITVSCTVNTVLEVQYVSQGRFYGPSSSVNYHVRVDNNLRIADTTDNVLSGADVNDYIDKATTGTTYYQPYRSASIDVVWNYLNEDDYTHIYNTLIVKVYEPIPLSAGELGSTGVLILLIMGILVINIIYLNKDRKRKR